MEEKPELYFMALIPPPAICEQVNVFKQDLRERFGSQAALKTVPHITLKAPFKLPASAAEELKLWFHQLPLKQAPFRVELKDFGCFPKAHSPVLFLKPLISPELSALQQLVITEFRKAYPGIPVTEQELEFHPHITIAYRDLKPDMFAKAWVEYSTKKYQASFLVESIYLLHHDEKKWHVVTDSFLKK
jgi:2'-5' RNA ligase